MLGRFGLWLARGGAATFTIMGFFYFFDAMTSNYGDNVRAYTTIAVLCFLTATVFYGIDQITTAIRELKGDESKGDDESEGGND